MLSAEYNDSLIQGEVVNALSWESGPLCLVGVASGAAHSLRGFMKRSEQLTESRECCTSTGVAGLGST